MNIWLLILISLVIPADAHAYVDPGTGSMMLQIILAGVFGVAIFYRTIISKLKLLFGIKEKSSETQESPSQTEAHSDDSSPANSND